MTVTVSEALYLDLDFSTYSYNRFRNVCAQISWLVPSQYIYTLLGSL